MKRIVKLMFILTTCMFVGINVSEAQTAKKKSSFNSKSQSTLPLVITAERLLNYGGDKLPLDTPTDEGNYVKEVFTIELMANGTYKASKVKSEKSYHTYDRWKEGEPSEFSGKWTLKYRVVGSGKQKVYALKFSIGYLDGEIYIPDDFKYMWEGDWEACDNMDTRVKWAYQITKVSKP